jgi:uncharacterized protein with PQ loop repeat
MTATSLLGILGTIIGLVRALPQLVTMLRARRAEGVSVDTAAVSAMVSFAWAVYGLWTDQPFVTLATGASGVVFLLIAIFALRYGRTLSELQIAPLWLAVLGVTAYLWGAAGLGIVLAVSILVSNLPQVRLAWREASLADLSLTTWLLSLADGLVWGLYALLEGDRSIMVFGVLQMTTSAAVVAAKLRSSR